jgi:hypothetical protein
LLLQRVLNKHGPIFSAELILGEVHDESGDEEQIQVFSWIRFYVLGETPYIRPSMDAALAQTAVH